MNQRLRRLVLFFLVACLTGCGALSRGNQAAIPTDRPSIADLPQPHPQPVTRTSAAAQVAWLWLQTGQSSSLVAFDASGHQAARLTAAAAASFGPYGIWRSPDGALIFGADAGSVTAYSALDGHLVRTYQRSPGSIAGDAFSPDGRYLALLIFGADRLELEMINLGTGRVVGPLPVAHKPGASMPGMIGSSSVWAATAFGPASDRLFTLSDWGDVPQITAYGVGDDALRSLGTAALRIEPCGGPATTIKVVDAGARLAAFCHFTGAVWLIDLRTLGNAAVLHSNQTNPFAATPAYTPDGQLLYVLEGTSVQVVDLHRQKLLGPVSISTTALRDNPLSALASLFVTDAEAGWVASTVPIAPDGLTLYLAGSDGILALRIPDLKVIGRLAPGLNINEVWISGDGRKLFATADDGHRLAVINADGGPTRSISLSATPGGFVSSEHG
ncbi:MAG TPA: hypothetical protein VII89_00870 [Candidatus Dormibacteraeota bacterium]